MLMDTRWLRPWLLLLMGVGVAGIAQAQPLGTYRWQLTPYCNVLTLAVTQIGGQYRLEGFDDQCGNGPRAAVTGLVVPNPDATLEFGLTIVTSTTALPAHVDVTFSVATLGGTWRDSAGASGAFVFNPPAPAAGPARPAPFVPIPDGTVGAADINPAEVQRRVSGACGAGLFVQAVHADGGVNCAGDAGGGYITDVTAGPGLTGGGTSGAVSLGVAFEGSGTATLAARSDHSHRARGDLTSTAIGDQAYPVTQSGPRSNTAVGYLVLGESTGDGNFNTGIGAWALRNSTGSENTAIGASALSQMTTGENNVAVGRNAMLSNAGGVRNTAVGHSALRMNTSNDNTALGYAALYGSEGSRNIAIGHQAGVQHENGFNNIYIDHPGETSESNAIRIGTGQVETYIAGIHGRTSSSGTAVFVNSLGKLGTTTSSRRFKDHIAPLEDVSARIQALRPVTFFYKPEFDDGTRVRQYGLIAEEVDEVLPDLVVRDEHGRVETVRYHFLNTLLLAEVQRLERAREDQDRVLTQQVQRLIQQAREIEDLRAMVEALSQRR
jgi:hypothetical protein